MKQDQNRNLKAVIVAGGKGKRLGSLTENTPKPMVIVAGKPVLQHQLEVLKKHNIQEVFLLTGYKADIIEAFFGSGQDYGLKIHYIQEQFPLGTAGCIKVLESVLNEDFLLIYGDLIFDIDIGHFYKYHKKKKGLATLFAHPNDHPSDSDLLLVNDQNLITKILKKPHSQKILPNLSNAAVYLLSPMFFLYIKKNQKADFMHDIFPDVIADGHNCYAYKSTEYLKDMGTPSRLKKTEEDVIKGRVSRLSRNNKQTAVFLDRDGTLVTNIDLLHRADDLELISGVAGAVKKINRAGLLSFLVTNQSVVARNLCSMEELGLIHNKLEYLLIKEAEAYLNEIFFCPHHPDKGYPEENPLYKIQCNCRKPGTGMIEKAVRHYNVDIESSWIVGDSMVDIMTGKNAGLKTILIQTGETQEDDIVKPDFVCKELMDAVDTILEVSLQ